MELDIYQNLFADIKQRILSAQLKAALSVNSEMIFLYWQIGNSIAQKQSEKGWSSGVIPQLAKDLKNEFPNAKGYSERNLGRMLAFYREYPNEAILPQLVAKLPWGNVIELKNTKFKPEYTGKLNFYLSAVDSLIKEESENPTIGILLCKDKNNIEAEFALRDIHKPIGISEIQLVEKLPDHLQSVLPSIEDIENELKNFGNIQNEQ